MALKSKFESSGFGHPISGSSLPKFDLPKFEPSRFNRLKQELIPPRFDFPRFELNGPDSAHSQSTSTSVELPKLELNWFSLLHHRVALTKVEVSKLGLSKSNTPATIESANKDRPETGSNNNTAVLPESDPPEVEAGGPNRLKQKPTRPQFDLPKLDEPDGSDGPAVQESSQD